MLDLVKAIAQSSSLTDMQTRIIGIDGGGGAGKSTLAEKLATELGHCPILHTDDFASWDNPLNWYPRMIEQVLKPLSLNQKAKFQRFDWSQNKLADWIEVEPQEFIILEGVSSSRREFRPYLSFSIFVSTPAQTRLQRGLARDGDAAKENWLQWMAAEDEYFKRDEPEKYANLVVSGDSSDEHKSK